MIRIEIERLALHEITTDDAEFLQQLQNEPSFLKNIGDKNVRTIADAASYALNWTESRVTSNTAMVCIWWSYKKRERPSESVVSSKGNRAGC